MSDASIATMTFGRRVGIAAAVFLAAHVASMTLRLLNILVLAYRSVPDNTMLVFLAINFAIVCAVIFGTLQILAQAQARVASGVRHWLASMPERRLILVLTGLLLASRVAPHATMDSSLYAYSGAALPTVYFYAMSGLSFALAVASCYIWIWWCNGPPRTERLIIVAALAWCGFEFLMVVFDLITPGVYVLVSRGIEEGRMLHLPGSDASVTFDASAWIWRVGPERFLPSLRSWFMHVAGSIPVAAIAAAVLYRLLDRQSAPAGTP